jgi:uncharacterized protein (TIGR02246 family)
MKRIAIALLLASVVGPPALRAGQAEDEASIRKFGLEFAAAWNKHDPKAMAAYWAEDGDLINPFGRVAKGRAEVEKLFHDEHAGPMAGTTYATTLSSVRFPTADLALSDWEIVVTGMRGPDGTVGAPFKPHVFIVLTRKGGQWLTAAARPYQFLSPPPAGK